MSNSVKNASIQQINVTYNATEDRLLLRIGISNQTELLVWITRRVAKKIAQLLHGVPISIPNDSRVNVPYNQEIEQQFAKEAMRQKLDFSSKYEQRESLNQGQFFLAHDCRMNESKQQRILELLCSNRQTVSLTLNDEFLLGLSSMLQLASQQAAWDFALPEQALLTSPTNSTTLLH